MYAGQLVFAQLMEHLPWQTFRQLVERYRGDCCVRDFSCANQFRCMAFAQLTYRERLRAYSAKLYHLGVRGSAARSTLADAYEWRDRRIHAEVAQHPIRIARRLSGARVPEHVRIRGRHEPGRFHAFPVAA